MLKAGIVGLPNVGKSTLFNAVTRTRKAEAANYPFCTIDPNVGIVTVPDARLEVLKNIAKTTVIIPAAVEFVDIAGLVKGASAGEGLGNKFLTHIREVDALIQVVRCFERSTRNLFFPTWRQSRRSGRALPRTPSAEIRKLWPRTQCLQNSSPFSIPENPPLPSLSRPKTRPWPGISTC